VKIIGHGVDLVTIDRVAKSLSTYGDRFRERVFTPAEAAYCDDSRKPAQHFAARFAAKEAVLKALGTGWSRGIAWTDIEVVLLPSGAPTVRITGQAAEIASASGITGWFLSISHTDGVAMASVIAVAD